MTSKIINLSEEDCFEEKKVVFTLNNETAITLINFYKIFKDLIMDLNTSFNDKVGAVIANNKDYQNIINYCLPNYKENMNADEYINSIELESINKLFEYEKIARDIDSIDDIETVKEFAKAYVRLYLKQQEVLSSLGSIK